MELEFAGQHDKATYFMAIRWIYKPSRRDMIIRISAFVVFAVLYAVLVFTTFKKEGASTFEFSRLIRHLLTLFILAYVLFQPYLKSFLTASRLWKDPLIRRKISGRISSQGIQIDPSIDWMGWDQFVKVHKSADMVVLLTAARLFVILPRSFFQNDGDWQVLQSLISTRTQEVIE